MGGYLWGARVAATPLCSRISAVSAATTDGRLAWVVNRRFRWIKNPVPKAPLGTAAVEAVAVIVAMAWAFPVKIAAFILSDLLTPLQKHHDSLRLTPPIIMGVSKDFNLGDLMLLLLINVASHLSSKIMGRATSNNVEHTRYTSSSSNNNNNVETRKCKRLELFLTYPRTLSLGMLENAGVCVFVCGLVTQKYIAAADEME